ncbi:helix-turn-helix transcriptional regulator [Erwiniaceae bacterium L1_54_6]|jgi:luxR family transcriptional regulator, regulator of transport and utilization of aryl beta-glucosides|nr:helix-turn-helix transcriptional regulator [Erwiniaceae bacterium L1_54_6]
MNILIITQNTYLEIALKEILDRTLICDYQLTFRTKSSIQDISDADIIIMTIRPGEIYLCNPTFRYRKKESHIIFISIGRVQPVERELPFCYRNATYLNSEMSVPDIFLSFGEACKKNEMACCASPVNTSCVNCPCLYLTPAQLKVTYGFMGGLSLQEIARALSLSLKTVHTQKKRIMNPLGIRSDQDLFHLLKGVRLTHTLPLIKEK